MHALCCLWIGLEQWRMFSEWPYITLQFNVKSIFIHNFIRLKRWWCNPSRRSSCTSPYLVPKLTTVVAPYGGRVWVRCKGTALPFSSMLLRTACSSLCSTGRFRFTIVNNSIQAHGINVFLEHLLQKTVLVIIMQNSKRNIIQKLCRHDDTETKSLATLRMSTTAFISGFTIWQVRWYSKWKDVPAGSYYAEYINYLLRTQAPTCWQYPPIPVVKALVVQFAQDLNLHTVSTFHDNHKSLWTWFQQSFFPMHPTKKNSRSILRAAAVLMTRRTRPTRYNTTL